MNTKQIRVETSYRVCLRKPNNQSYQNLWLGLHGYGQLAPYFMDRFAQLPPDHQVIVPEAPSRFYLSGTSGRIGASWMTREDRLTDIENYLQYLDRVYEEFIIPIPPRRMVVFGFSQGAATACRWMIHRQPKHALLILWAGIFPEDLPMPESNFLRKIKVYLVLGDKDPYITESRKRELDLLLEKYGIVPHLLRYPGDHRINPNQLNELLSPVFSD